MANIRCLIYRGSYSPVTSAPAVFTVLPGIGKVKNLGFDPRFSQLMWQEPQAFEVDIGGFTYNVTVTDTVTDSVNINALTTITYEQTSKREQIVPCRDYLAEVAAIATDARGNNITGLTAETTGVANGNFYQLGDLSFSTPTDIESDKEAATLSVPLNLPANDLAECPQQLIVDYGTGRYHLDTAAFAREVKGNTVLPVDITLQMNQTTYNVTASILDERGELEDETSAVLTLTPQTSSTSTPAPTLTPTTSAAMPATNPAAVTLTVTSQDGAQTHTRTIIVTPTPASTEARPSETPDNPADNTVPIITGTTGGVLLVTGLAMTVTTAAVIYVVKRMKSRPGSMDLEMQERP